MSEDGILHDLLADRSLKSDRSSEAMQDTHCVYTYIENARSPHPPAFYLVDNPETRTGLLAFVVIYLGRPGEFEEKAHVVHVGFLHTQHPRYRYGRLVPPGASPFDEHARLVQCPTLVIPLKDLFADEIMATNFQKAENYSGLPEPQAETESHANLSAWEKYDLLPRGFLRMPNAIDLLAVHDLASLRIRFLGRHLDRNKVPITDMRRLQLSRNHNPCDDRCALALILWVVWLYPDPERVDKLESLALLEERTLESDQPDSTQRAYASSRIQNSLSSKEAVLSRPFRELVAQRFREVARLADRLYTIALRPNEQTGAVFVDVKQRSPNVAGTPLPLIQRLMARYTLLMERHAPLVGGGVVGLI